MIDGGVCHRTSTPHKSGNKMKEKKNRLFSVSNSGNEDNLKFSGIAQ